MMYEEDYLRKKMGVRNPFTVPEGYFEGLTEQVMSRLPVQAADSGDSGLPKPVAKTAVMRRLRPWLYAAACLFVAVFVAAAVFNSKQADQQTAERKVAQIEQQGISYYSDNYIEEEADYAMIDNQEIYACLLADM